MKTWLPMIVAIAVAATAYVQTQREREAVRELRGEMSAAREQTREAVERFQQSHALLRQVAARHVNENATQREAPVVQAPPTSPPPATQPPPALTGEDMADRAEQQFRAEYVDRSWAFSVENRLSTALRALGADAPVVRGVACRDSLCRVELDHSNESMCNAFAEHTLLRAQEPLWTGEVFHHCEEGDSRGQVRSVAYLVREGRTLSFGDD